MVTLQTKENSPFKSQLESVRIENERLSFKLERNKFALDNLKGKLSRQVSPCEIRDDYETI